MVLLDEGAPVQLGHGVQAALRVFMESEEALKRDGDRKMAGQTAVQTTGAPS